MTCECTVTLAELAAASGVHPDGIRNAVGEHQLVPDSWDGKPRVAVAVAREFVANTRRATARHEALVREHEASLHARGAERKRACREVFERTYRERLKAKRDFYVKQLPVTDGVVLMGVSDSIGGRRNARRQRS